MVWTFCTPRDRKKLRSKAKRGRHLLRAGVPIEEVKNIIFEDSTFLNNKSTKKPSGNTHSDKNDQEKS